MSVNQQQNDTFTIWEVFMQAKNGGPHQHVGNVHAADAEMALQNARDVYGRRGGQGSIWVMAADLIYASGSEDEAPFFDPGDDKMYRHPNFYRVPKSIKNIED